MKRVIIIHGWDGYPENHWFPWLKKELEKRKIKVIIPAMPNTEEPKINEWVFHLKKITGKVDRDTYFVGHSIGCQAIIRYLETLSDDKKVGGVILVAGWFNLKGLETQEEKDIAKPWLEILMDTKKIRKRTKNFVAIFSDDDDYVMLSDAEIFKEKLNAKIIVEKNRGHFTDDAGVTELPVVLNELMEMMR